MHSRLKRLLATAALAMTTITGSLVAAPAAQATPAEPFVPHEVPAQVLPDATAADMIGSGQYPVIYHGLDVGYIEIYVYSSGKKLLKVCDTLGDLREPTLQVDPSYDEPLLYQDPNASAAGCLVHGIWYPVRKFRIGYHEEGNATIALMWEPWFNTPPVGPLPYPDF